MWVTHLGVYPDLSAQVPVTFVYGEHDWMNPAAGVAVAEILDKVRERKVCARPQPKQGQTQLRMQLELIRACVPDVGTRLLRRACTVLPALRLRVQ